MKKRLFFSLSFIVIITLALLILFSPRESENAIMPVVGGSTLISTPVGVIPYHLQNDSRWSEETIGGSGERMAAAGCTITCIAMGLSALGYELNPSQECALLKQQEGFTGNGYVIWDKVGGLTDGAIRIALSPARDEKIAAELRQRRPVIAKIFLQETIQHWVLIVGKDGEDYLVMDPLNQHRALVKVSDLATKIEAIRVFVVQRDGE